MILDTSAVIAVLQSEEGAPRLVAALENAPVKRMSAANLVEAGIILQARLYHPRPGLRVLSNLTLSGRLKDRCLVRDPFHDLLIGPAHDRSRRWVRSPGCRTPKRRMCRQGRSAGISCPFLIHRADPKPVSFAGSDTLLKRCECSKRSSCGWPGTASSQA